MSKEKVAELCEITEAEAASTACKISAILEAKTRNAAVSSFFQKPSPELLIVKEKLEEVEEGVRGLKEQLGFTQQAAATASAGGLGLGSSSISEEEPAESI